MTIQPYENGIEYIEDELSRYLPARAARINARWNLKDLAHSAPDKRTVGEKQQVLKKEYERRIHQYRKQEMELRNEIDARLEATRNGDNAKTAFNLGLPDDRQEFDARLILLTLTATALGMGEETIGEFGLSYIGGVTVGDITTMLQVKTVADRLRVRRLILDLTGMGLIVLDYPGRSFTPEDFHSTGITISSKAFAVILDDPSLENEGVVPKQSR